MQSEEGKIFIHLMSTSRDKLHYTVSNVKCSGQPWVREKPKKYKDLVMVSLVADGSCLPPVIMTDDKYCPQISFDDASVLKVKSSRAASVDNMKRWLDQISPYLRDEPYLLMDPHRSRFSPSIEEDLEDLGITLLSFPAGTGKVLDPVDNSFSAPVKTYYYTQPHNTHLEMLHAIHDAYYQPSDETVRRYWASIGYTTNRDLNTVVKGLAMRGWSKGSISQEQQRQWIQMYEEWKRESSVLYLKGVLPKNPPHSLAASSLDGKYWKAYRVA